LPSVDVPTLFRGDFSYRVTVPAGAARLTLRLETETPGAELVIFARAGQDIAWVNNVPVADHFTESPSTTQTLVITSNSTPALRPGVYFIALGLFTVGRDVTAKLTATVEGQGAAADPQLMLSGVPVNFSLPAVEHPSLFNGEFTYRIAVPANARQLQVRLATATQGVDLDLYVRFGAEVEVNDGRLLTDFGSDGPAGSEMITITPGSTPALRAGVYAINLASLTVGRAATGTLTATITQ
jgi:hypothetical protein